MGLFDDSKMEIINNSFRILKNYIDLFLSFSIPIDDLIIERCPLKENKHKHDTWYWWRVGKQEILHNPGGSVIVLGKWFGVLDKTDAILRNKLLPVTTSSPQEGWPISPEKNVLIQINRPIKLFTGLEYMAL